jgi:hypothetical protein
VIGFGILLTRLSTEGRRSGEREGNSNRNCRETKCWYDSVFVHSSSSSYYYYCICFVSSSVSSSHPLTPRQV